MEVGERMMTNGVDNDRRSSPSPHRGGNGDMNNGNGNRDSRERSPQRGNSRERSPIRNGGSPNRGGSPGRDDKRRSNNNDNNGGAYGDNRNRLANTASPSNVLGVFGLSPSTEERDLKDEFTKFGKIDHVDLIMDRKTGRSKCFGFVYFENKDDAIRAKEECQDLQLHGKSIRTDFSATKRPHDPTPGKYFGNPRYDSRGRSPPRFSPYGGGRGDYNGRGGDYGGRGGDRYGREERGGGDRYGGRDERAAGGDRYGGRDERAAGGDRYGGRDDRYGRDDRDRHRDDSRDRYSGRDERGGDRYGRDDRFRDDRPRDGYRR